MTFHRDPFVQLLTSNPIAQANAVTTHYGSPIVRVPFAEVLKNEIRRKENELNKRIDIKI